MGPRTLVTGNISTGNHTGIIANIGSTLIGNTVGVNAHYGIIAYESTVVNNSSRNNPNSGIYVECPSAVIANTSAQNGANLTMVGVGCTSDHNAAP